MAGLGDLIIKLSADTTEFQSDMGRAAHLVERDMERMAARATAAGQLIGDAIGKVAQHFARLAVEAVKVGDELNKLSQKSGMSVERLSEIRFAGELADVSMGQLTGSLGFFNKALAEAQNETSRTAQVFKALGVDINAGPQAAFDQFMRAINTLPDGETKVAAMRIAFGRAGDALIPLSAGMDDAAEKARRLGLVFSQQMAKDSEAFNDNMKTLAATTQGLVIQLSGPMVSGLSSLTQNLLAAKMQGDSLLGTWREIQKVTAALISQIPVLGKLLDPQIEKAFGQRLGTPGATGSWGDGPMGPPSSAANAEAVACVVSGGRWEGGKCVRAGSGGSAKAPKSDIAFIAKQLAEGEEEWQRVFTEAWGFYSESRKRITDEEIAEEMRKRQAAFDAIDREQEEAIAQSYAYLAALKKQAKETDDIARELGLTFSSSFEDAITGAKSFGEVLRGLAMDIAKLFFRKTVTTPLLDASSSFFKSLDIGSWFGVGTPSAPGSNVVPDVGATVASIGPTASASRAPAVVNISMPFSANTPEAVRAAVQSAAPALVEAAKRGVMESQLRGNRV